MTDYRREYEFLHEKRGGKYFSGKSMLPYADQIAELVLTVQPRRILDYGSGKGHQYLAHRAHEKWGGPLPICYDIGVPELQTRPQGLFEGLICTDVMEHIAEPDVDGVLADALGFINPHAHAFAFLAIACRPAKGKKLSDGRNVHLTVKPPEWWLARLERFRRPGLELVAEFDEG